MSVWAPLCIASFWHSMYVIGTRTVHFKKGVRARGCCFLFSQATALTGVFDPGGRNSGLVLCGG